MTRGIELVLPGNWRHFPLGDEAGTRRAIGAYVQHQVPRSDELATLRHRLRGELDERISDTRATGATDLYLAERIAPGVPLSASMAVFWPRTAPLPAQAAASPHLARSFLKGLLNADAVPAAEAEFDLADQAVLRRTFVEDPLPGIDPAMEGYAHTFRSDIWITVPGQARWLLLSFASAWTAHFDALVALFDAVAGTLRWGDLDALPDAVPVTREQVQAAHAHDLDSAAAQPVSAEQVSAEQVSAEQVSAEQVSAG